VTLSNKTRGELETVRPFCLDTTKDALLLRCLDTYAVWALKNDVSVTPSLLHYGHWEAWITSWFTSNIEEGDFIVDVGANCGYYTMLFETLAGPTGRVVAYECNPVYVGLLNMTKVSNKADFVVEGVALSSSKGIIDLVFPGEYTGSASIAGIDFDPKYGETHKITVPTATLDEEFEGMDTPTLIKIDAEGAEEMVLKGAQKLLARHDAPVIVLEYTPNAYSEDFNDWLFGYGDVTRIGFDGVEEPCTIEHLKSLTDWDMIVVRKK
jgi:FkbM family methyltransferase